MEIKKILSEAKDIENKLWQIGLKSHLLSEDERRQYIGFINQSKGGVDTRILISGLSHLMHVYYFIMSEEEKELYLTTILSIEGKDVDYGNLLEMLGILSKGCPQHLRSRLFNYVIIHAEECASSASGVISLCNCIRYLYDDERITERRILVDLLNKIRERSDTCVHDSIAFTLDSLIEG